MAETITEEAKPPQNTVSEEDSKRYDADVNALANYLENKILMDNPDDKPPEVSEDLEPSKETVDQPTELEVEDQVELPDPDVPSNTESESESESRGVTKRIGKLTARAKDAEEKLEATERRANDAEDKLKELNDTPQSAPEKAHPFNNVWDPGKLLESKEQFRQLKKWCSKNRDGTEYNGHEFTSDDVAKMLDDAEDALEVHIPARMSFIQHFRQTKPIAEQLYPFWKDRSHADYNAAQEVLREMPQLAQHPQHQILIGDFIEGRKLRVNQEADKKKVKIPMVKAPLQPGTPAAIPAKQEAPRVMKQALANNFEKTGSVEDLGKLFEQII